MTIPHEPWLVALSIAIAIQGSFVGLSLARGIDSAEGFRRRLAIAGSAITLATGVWSMHFVAMLAANFPSAVDYLVLPTLISFLICVIVVGIGVYAAHMPGPPAFRIGTGALAMGLGVSLMHYVGMSAVHLAGPTSYAPSYVVASIAVVDRGQRLCFVDDRQPADPPAVVPRRDRARPGDFRNALYGDGRDAPRPAVLRRFALRRRRIGAVAQRAGAARHDRCVRRVRRLSSLARAGCERAPRRRGGSGGDRSRPRRAPRQPTPRLEPTPFQRVAARRAAAAERAASIRVEKDGRPRDIAVSDIYASAPMPTTPTSTTARRNISARFRSARSKRASIRRRS